jgi:hypothetical protein
MLKQPEQLTLLSVPENDRRESSIPVSSTLMRLVKVSVWRRRVNSNLDELPEWLKSRTWRYGNWKLRPKPVWVGSLEKIFVRGGVREVYRMHGMLVAACDSGEWFESDIGDDEVVKTGTKIKIKGKVPID